MSDSNGKEVKTPAITEQVSPREFIKLNRQAYGYGWDILAAIPATEEEAKAKRARFFDAITLLEQVDDELQTAFGNKGGYSSAGKPPKRFKNNE